MSSTRTAYRCFSSMEVSDVEAVATELERIVGPKGVTVGREVRRKYLGDMSWLTYIHAHFDQPLNRPDLAVSPKTTEQVSEVMKVASRRRLPVTPVGGASGVQGAANANCGGILLDLWGMNRVRDTDLESLTCTAEAGVNVKLLEEQLNVQGLSFTHYPASAEWASVGGAVAARGSGVLSTKYGNIQDHVLSLEVVLPSGEVVQLPAVPKHGVGPELTQLFVGSEGTLGVITAVRIKLRRLPVKRRFSAFRFEGLAGGIDAGREIMTTGLRPAVMRLYDKYAATQSLERAVEAGLDSETMVLMVDGDHERIIDLEGSLCDEICVKHGGHALPSSIGQKWWDRRYVFYHPPHAPELPQIWCTMDAVSDYRHLPGLYDKVTRAMREAVDPKWGLTLKTHLSHWFDWGAMIYPRFNIPKGPDDLESAVELHDRIIGAAVRASLEAGGVMNDHHGVGMRLAPYMEAQLGAAGMTLLKGIKVGIDPDRILCPGKLAMG